MSAHRVGPILAEWVLCSCGKKFQRGLGDTDVTCLGCQTQARLRDAGIDPGDPALAFIAAMNETARRKAGITTDLAGAA